MGGKKASFGFAAGLGTAYPEPAMRHFFSTFASGRPGLGLLLLRLIAGIMLIMHWMSLHNGASLAAAMPHMIAAAGGLLLLAGVWTPVAGAIVAIAELWIVFSHGSDPVAEFDAGRPRRRPGAAGSRNLVGGCAAVRVEADRDSASLTDEPMFSASTPAAPHPASSKQITRKPEHPASNSQFGGGLLGRGSANCPVCAVLGCNP